MYNKILGISALCFLFYGCASTTQAVPFPDQSVELENPDLARVYVVRPSAIGSAVSMKVYDGSTYIGKTGAKGYLCWEREASPTTIVSKAENEEQLYLELEKGEVYFVKQNPRMGVLYARNKLTQMDEGQGRQELSKCKPPSNVRRS